VNSPDGRFNIDNANSTLVFTEGGAHTIHDAIIDGVGNVQFSWGAGVEVDGNVHITNGIDNGMSLTGQGTVQIWGDFSWGGGSWAGSGSIIVQNGAVFRMYAGTLSRELRNVGTVRWTLGDIRVTVGGSITNIRNFDIYCDNTMMKDGNAGSFTNEIGGTITKHGGQGVTTIEIPPDVKPGSRIVRNMGQIRFGPQLRNQGAIELNGGGLALFCDAGFIQDGGTLTIAGTASMQVTGNFDLNGGTVTNSGGLTVSGDFVQNGGATDTTGPMTVAGAVLENAGTFNLLWGATLTASGGVTIASGALFNGSGIIVGNVTNSGTLYTGSEMLPMLLTISGSFTQSESGTLAIMGSSGHLTITGAANLAGTLKIRGIEGGGPYTLIDWASFDGAFIVDLLPPPTGTWVWSYFDPPGHFTLWLDTQLPPP
jgi:hypothetical protein